MIGSIGYTCMPGEELLNTARKREPYICTAGLKHLTTYPTTLCVKFDPIALCVKFDFSSACVVLHVKGLQWLPK